jgi:selenium metabolism protein YedF
MKTLDARGKLCPVPLVMTKKALLEIGKDETMEILLDNETSAHNVVRFLMDNGFSVEKEQKGKEFRLTVGVVGAFSEKSQPEDYCQTPSQKTGNYLVAFLKNTLGEGERELGEVLIKGFINTLPDASSKPTTVVFLNSGIWLALKDSPVIEALKKLEQNGTKVLVCGTCLDYYGKKEELGVGIVSNMYDILEEKIATEKVLYP